MQCLLRSMLMLINKLLQRIRLLQCMLAFLEVVDLYFCRPTFKLFKDGQEVDSVRGADAATLEAKIRQHYVVPENSEISGSASSVSGYPDITSNVDVKNVDSILVSAHTRWNA